MATVRGQDERGAAPGEFRLGYCRGLDGLRCLAVTAVVFSHAGLAPAPAGFVGVHLFFALSGFLITSLLVEEYQRHGGICLWKFYLRRVLRLFPALVVMLTAYVAYLWAVGPRPEAAAMTREALTALVYWTNWARAAGPVAWLGTVHPYGLGHTWSLGIEEQFYLVWPPVLWWLLRRVRSRASLVNWVLLACFAAAVNRWLRCVAWPDYYRINFGTDTQADSLLWGCAAAVAVQWGPVPRGPRAQRLLAWAVPLSLAGLTGMWFQGYWSFEVLVCVGYPLIAVLAMLAVAGVVMAPASPVGRALSARVPVYLGRISYGIYLWHFPIFLETQARHLPFARGLAIEFGLTALAVLGSYYLIERPFLRLKARLRD